MKIDWNKKYTTIALYACAIIAATVFGLFIVLNPDRFSSGFSRLGSILNPFIIGFSIAYLFNPTMKWCEKILGRWVEKRKPRPRLLRSLCILITYIIYLIILTVLFALIIPQVVVSYNDLMGRADVYINSLTDLLNRINAMFPSIDLGSLFANLTEFLSDTYALVQNVTPHLTNFLTSFVDQLKNALLGVMLSIYFLYYKENLLAGVRRMLHALVSEKAAAEISAFMKLTDETFGGFIIGKLLDSAIIGVLTLVVLMICRMPYYPLIAVIIGVTNVIPFFGPFIGAIPSAFIIFIVDPIKMLWFVLIILIIQQLDGNVIGPKILGQSTGLSSLGVIVAITVMSGLLGMVGMFIGVPLFSLLYMLFNRLVDYLLARKEAAAQKGGEEP